MARLVQGLSEGGDAVVFATARDTYESFEDRMGILLPALGLFGAMLMGAGSIVTYSLYVPAALVAGMTFADSYAFLDDWVLQALRGELSTIKWMGGVLIALALRFVLVEAVIGASSGRCEAAGSRGAGHPRGAAPSRASAMPPAASIS